MAVESFKNIANAEVTVTGGMGGAVSAPEPDADVDAIADLLKDASAPVAIADLTTRLGWDSGRTADALARGGDRGRLSFVRYGDRTFVGLPAFSSERPAAPAA